jgi:alkylhydroperoxidase family enzyme
MLKCCAICVREFNRLQFIFNTWEIAVAHIQLQEGVPGIRGPMAFRPETAKPIRELAEVLLRSPHTLSPGEREAIATYVSSQNDCCYQEVDVS